LTKAVPIGDHDLALYSGASYGGFHRDTFLAG
jgi:hypothetical protein